MTQVDPLVPILQEGIGAFMRGSMRSLILYMKENGLSMSQIGALFQIHRGRSNVSDLGEWLGVSNAAASQMLERMVQQGLIVRSQDPQDRRAKHLALTGKGCQIMQASLRARQGWLEELAALLTPAEREQVAAAVKIMTEKTNRLDPPSASEP